MFEFDGFHINPIEIKDASHLCDFVISNEDRLKFFFPGTLAQNLTLDLSQHFVETKIKQFNTKEEFLFTIKEKEAHHIVGLIYLKELDWTKKQGEFAYCIGYQYEGKGFTSKSIRILSQYAFNTLKLKTLQIIAHKTNMSSLKVAENCDFIWQRTLKNEYTPPRKNPLDMELYELYNER